MICSCKRLEAICEKMQKVENENILLRKSLTLCESTLSQTKKKLEYHTSYAVELTKLKQIEKEVLIFMHVMKEGKLKFDVIKDHLRHKINPEDLRETLRDYF